MFTAARQVYLVSHAPISPRCHATIAARRPSRKPLRRERSPVFKDEKVKVAIPERSAVVASGLQHAERLRSESGDLRRHVEVKMPNALEAERERKSCRGEVTPSTSVQVARLSFLTLSSTSRSVHETVFEAALGYLTRHCGHSIAPAYVAADGAQIFEREVADGRCFISFIPIPPAFFAVLV